MKKRMSFFAFVMCATSSLMAKPYVNTKGYGLKHHAKEAEVKHGIPENLLMAIAHFESNKSAYAVNARGRGHFFKTKEQAAAFIDKLVKEGYKNINVGCMQLNYAAHRKRFKSLEDMLEPEKNIAYAARLLVSLKRSHGSWERAVEAYKGSFSETSQNYRSRIFSLRFKLPKVSIPKNKVTMIHKVKSVQGTKKAPTKYCVTAQKDNASQVEVVFNLKKPLLKI